MSATLEEIKQKFAEYTEALKWFEEIGFEMITKEEPCSYEECKLLFEKTFALFYIIGSGNKAFFKMVVRRSIAGLMIYIEQTGKGFGHGFVNAWYGRIDHYIAQAGPGGVRVFNWKETMSLLEELIPVVRLLKDDSAAENLARHRMLDDNDTGKEAFAAYIKN